MKQETIDTIEHGLIRMSVFSMMFAYSSAEELKLRDPTAQRMWDEKISEMVMRDIRFHTQMLLDMHPTSVY